MRNFLALLLLFWMPLQACLAAFEETHGHHDHAATLVAHAHPHGDASTTLDSDEPVAGESDCVQDCSTSHFCNAQLLFLEHAPVTQVVAPSSARFADDYLVSLDRAAARPERPQWIASSY